MRKDLRLDQIHGPVVVMTDPETGLPLPPEAALRKLGELGWGGAVLNPSVPEPRELMAYSPEEEGSLGIATFEEVTDFAVSQGHTQAVATRVWQKFTSESSKRVLRATMFRDTEELRAQRDELIALGRNNSVTMQAINRNILEVYNAIYGRNGHVPWDHSTEEVEYVIRNYAQDPAVAGEPFIFIGSPDDPDSAEPYRSPPHYDLGRSFKGSYMYLDPAYAQLPPGLSYRHNSNKADIATVQFFNRRIDQVRAAAA